MRSRWAVSGVGSCVKVITMVALLNAAVMYLVY